MNDKAKTQTRKALQQWETEGGAIEPGSQVRKDVAPRAPKPPTAPWLANALMVLVPLSLMLMGYRYGHLSFELFFMLAGLFLAAVIAIGLGGPLT